MAGEPHKPFLLCQFYSGHKHTSWPLKGSRLSMMNKLKLKEDKMLEVQFVGDDDVLNHILDREGGTKLKKERAQLLVNPQKIIKKQEYDVDEGDQEVLKDQNYVEVLGRNVQGHSASDKAQPKNNGKNELQSSPPRNLRKRLKVPRSHSDSESEYSASNSEEDEGIAQESEDTNPSFLSQKIETQSRMSAPICRGTPSKKMRRDKTCDLLEKYFEAHSSSQVLTSDRTLQKLRRAALDQQTLRNLLSKVSPSFSTELKQLNQQYEKLFHKWMLQLHLGFNIVLYGLGSKRDLLERFRTTMLQDSVHVVINGFFPGIGVKSILNSITEEVLDHMGTFRSVLDQLDWIINRFKEDSALELFLLIHNLDSQMLRGDKSQQIIGQLSSLRNIYLVASIDHLNAPLMWDHAKQSLYNWLWYETTTYRPYTEETSYENSLLVKQSGALPLSALTHVLRSLTPNARGIFRLLTKYQLDKQEDPSYMGLSFQDFYQQCREAFLVNSDLTLRAQLTEFRDHKLIKTKKGTDGVEYLLIPIDSGTLTDFLEKEEEEEA
ncbi:Origin recognition complex subunit 2 [Fukomys damarensis]|uniref:Origin recognition complex subunit 2 n=1 Tax=Fukomys damarensis TaxID=885580 RepID=A0A091DYX2_FUKDA|nr:Origin recognition complex subunit 2 [Fukomys damarensis]